MPAPYYAGHQYFLRAADSTTVISNTTGAISSAPDIATAFDVGYISPNNVVISEGTRQGYAAGRESASYTAKGWRSAMLSADIRLGSVAFIKDKCLAAGTTLPYQDLYYGVSAAWARAIYKARCSRLSLAFPMGDATELTASASFEGQAYGPASPVTLGYSYEQFGPALLATDVRTALIGSLDIRQNLMAVSVDIDRQIERKNGRPDFGDNVIGSRTSYDIITHHKVVTGSIQIHDLPTIESGLFYAAVSSMRWSNLVFTINDIAVSQIYDVTITNPRPVQRQLNAVGSEGQLNWTIPFVADDLTISTSRP